MQYIQSFWKVNTKANTVPWKYEQIGSNGKQQHGSKRKKSTATAGALLQSLIARAADENCYVVMASLDLSMAFDMVNTVHLIKRLRIMGMPVDLLFSS